MNTLPAPGPRAKSTAPPTSPCPPPAEPDVAADSSPNGQLVADESPLRQLLHHSTRVGGVYSMTFDEALVLTNDAWKRQAGGLPRHGFILAAAGPPGAGGDTEDEEVILLRVVGPAPLPAEPELERLRAEAMRQMITTQGGGDGTGSSLDVLTRNEMQFSALRAKVLGTFYETTVGETRLLVFGNDLDTLYASSRYQAYKPHGESLAIVASYPLTTEREERHRQEGGPEPRRVRIGTVRYSSTLRRSRMSGRQEVPVLVNVQDFVAMKSAILGMTRLGKSNVVKTLSTAVFRHAAETGQRIGQLLFDLTAEYSNINHQDGTALAALGPEFVTIFRYGADGRERGIRPLCTNFYSDRTIEVTWSILSAYLGPRRGAAYVSSFLAADVIGPRDQEEDRSAYHRARRRRAALYATLLRAGFRAPSSFRTTILVNRQVLGAVNERVAERGGQPFRASGNGAVALDGADLRLFWDCLLAARDAGAELGDWIDPGLDAVLAFYRGSVGSGYRLLEPLRPYHSLARDDDYCEEVLKELIAGKIVIVDLSLGTEEILQACAERIVNHIVDAAARRFAQGLVPHQIQIFIEEAHRLFNRNRMAAPESRDPYVRLAKEAAKFHIGLVYATQEVTSVDPLILSNTSNWVVAHLNNRVEVGELARYYDFGDFADLTIKAEDVGFVRLKTRSNRFIVAVQVDHFNEATVAAAREAAARHRSPNGTHKE